MCTQLLKHSYRTCLSAFLPQSQLWTIPPSPPGFTSLSPLPPQPRVGALLTGGHKILEKGCSFVEVDLIPKSMSGWKKEWLIRKSVNGVLFFPLSLELLIHVSPQNSSPPVTERSKRLLRWRTFLPSECPAFTSLPRSGSRWTGRQSHSFLSVPAGVWPGGRV